MVGGMHGKGACMTGGRAWQGHMHGRGGVRGRVGVRATPGRYYGYGIRSMSGMHSCVILFQHSMQDSCRGAGTPTLYLPMFPKTAIR